MELNRLARVIRDRWRVVALIAAIGFFSAFGFTALANQNVEDRWEALIPLRFELEEGQTIDDLSAEIEDARGQAVLAAEDLLNQQENSSIFADTASGRLFFRAEADTREEALEKADQLVSAYLGSDQGGGNIEEQLEALAENAEEVSAEIGSIEVRLTQEEQGLLAQHELLDRQIEAVREQIVASTVADAGASAEVKEENAQRRADLESTLDDLFAQKSTLPPPPSTELSPADQLRVDSLNRQLELIGVEYQRLSLRTVGVLGENAQEEFPRTNSLTPAPANPVVNGVIGLMAGAALAMFALVFVTRSRKEVWLTEDLPVPVLGEVPNRRATNLPGPPWYDVTSGGRRKESIQATRTALEGALGHESASLAIVGDRVGPVSAHTFAVDLAASFASAGRSVLLVGADFSEPVEMTEFDVGEPTLNSVLATPAGAPQVLDDALEAVLRDAVQIRSGLAVLSAGKAPEAPADALAGQQFRRFIGLARERFDLVIAVGGEAEAASSQVLTQRLGAAIIAIAPGKTTAPRMNSVLVDMSHQNVALPGVVMIHGSESRYSLPPLPRYSANTAEPPPEPAQASVGRLGYYPFPGSKRSTERGAGSLDHLAAGLGRSTSEDGQLESEESDPVASQLIETLENSDPARAFDPVAEYVVARVEDMMTAVPGQANVSMEMVNVASDEAFVPLSPVRGVPTVWERLVAELTNEVGEAVGRQLAGNLAEVLTGDSRVESHAVDEWLTSEFFHRHLLNTDREPEVWHIASPKGAVHVLVNSRRLTEERLGRMTTNVARRRTHDLERELTAARERGDTDVASDLETDVKDARLFEISLGALRAGTRDEARLIYPWRKHDQMPRGWHPIWSEGIRPNIAPLQRLDLLAEPVLTDDELQELTPA